MMRSSLFVVSLLCGVSTSSLRQVSAFVPSYPCGALEPWGRVATQQQEPYCERQQALYMSASESGDKPKKIDKKWQKKRRRVALGENGLPIEPIYAPRQMAKNSQFGGSGPKKLRLQGKALEGGSSGGGPRLRIIGGTARGRKLDSPIVHLRPMMGKVREALFSTLESFGVFSTKNARVLDLFCGSGSVGLEALSRGAAEAVFVDLAKDCCEVAERNARNCGFEGRGRAVNTRAEEALVYPERFGVGGPFNLVTITPPYEEVVYAELIKNVLDSPVVVEDTLVVIEYPIELGSLPFNIGEGRLLGVRNRRYGRTVVAIYISQPSGKMGIDLRPEEFAQVDTLPKEASSPIPGREDGEAAEGGSE